MIPLRHIPPVVITSHTNAYYTPVQLCFHVLPQCFWAAPTHPRLCGVCVLPRPLSTVAPSHNARSALADAPWWWWEGMLSLTSAGPPHPFFFFFPGHLYLFRVQPETDRFYLTSHLSAAAPSGLHHTTHTHTCK